MCGITGILHRDGSPASPVVLKRMTDAVRHRLLESGWGFRGSLFPFARTLLRAGDERRQPDGDRLREYRDSNRGPLELGLFSPEPIHDDLEILQLSDSLSYLVLKLGADDPVVGAVLAGKSPRTRAAEPFASATLKMAVPTFGWVGPKDAR